MWILCGDFMCGSKLAPGDKGAIIKIAELMRNPSTWLGADVTRNQCGRKINDVIVRSEHIRFAQCKLRERRSNLKQETLPCDD